MTLLNPTSPPKLKKRFDANAVDLQTVQEACGDKYEYTYIYANLQIYTHTYIKMYMYMYIGISIYST